MKEAYKFFKKYYNNDFKIYLYIVFSFAAKICMLAIPYLMKVLIDQIQLANIEKFKNTSLLLILIMILFSIFLASKYYLQNYVEVKILNDLKKQMLGKISKVRIEMLKEISLGEFMQKVFNDTEVVKPLIVSVFVECILNIFYALGILIIMLSMNITLTLILTILIPIFIWFYKVYIPRIEKLNTEIIDYEENIKSLSEEVLNGSLDIKVNNANEFIEYKIHGKFSVYFKLILNKTKCLMQYDYILVTGIMNLATLLIYCLGGYLVFKSIISMGTLVSFTLYFSRLWDPVEYFMELSKEIKIQLISLNRIKEYLDIEEEEILNRNELPDFESLNIQKICFKYGERNIFENLSLTINSGEVIGIKGGNGTGKSTFANIIVKLVSGYTGEVYYNKINYRSIDAKEIRRKIIFIPSKTFLFNGSISENITLENSGDENKVNSLVKKWGIKSLIDVLYSNERSLETIINNQSNNLSGGEQKIIQILRGIFSNGDVYILDEPLNYVDKKHKKILLEFIKDNLKSKTVIIISHDEEVFQYCDKVYNLEGQFEQIK
ncbi:MAG: ABC transporter transmembrane domain-containing protein [Clostridium chrysemydis]|uniref:ABC transporter transmembrane domain-containing protein n=1 Tax=Clostridium chrysemydis TaxID=2665504 RepID=UPI003F38AD2D